MSTDTRPDAKTNAERATVKLRCAFCGTRNLVDMDRAADRPICGECGKPFLLDRPVNIAGEDLDAIVADAKVPLLVDFYADWCGPCKAMAPVLDELAAEHAGSLLVAKLDTDRAPQVSAALGIRGIPTLILYKDGKEVNRHTGAVPREALDRMVEAC